VCLARVSCFDLCRPTCECFSSVDLLLQRLAKLTGKHTFCGGLLRRSFPCRQHSGWLRVNLAFGPPPSDWLKVNLALCPPLSEWLKVNLAFCTPPSDSAGQLSLLPTTFRLAEGRLSLFSTAVSLAECQSGFCPPCSEWLKDKISLVFTVFELA
jgi:hypothetical protein